MSKKNSEVIIELAEKLSSDKENQNNANIKDNENANDKENENNKKEDPSKGNDNNKNKEDLKSDKEKKAANASKEAKKKKKESSENKIVEVDITLSVEDIYKLISKEGKIKSLKVIIWFIYLGITIQVLNTQFVLLMGYIRPPLITNTYSCYDINSLTYIKCYQSKYCKCSDKKCVYFCNEESLVTCANYFQSITSTSSSVEPLDLEKTKNYDVNYLQYILKKNDNISMFQRIKDKFCFIGTFIFMIVLDTCIGNLIGFELFKHLCEIKGKKFTILIMSIGILIVSTGSSVLSNFEIGKKFKLMCVLWVITYILIGVFLLPLESALQIYFLELYPKSALIKVLNGILYEKYNLSIFIFTLFNKYIKNYSYYFYFFQGYILIFIVVFFIFFVETPRFYSERSDFANKQLSIMNFSSEDVKFNYSNVNEDNKININKNYITSKYNDNLRIKKKEILIFVTFFSLQIEFYILLFSIIFDFCNPNLKIKGSIVRGVLILLMSFPLLQLPFNFCYELFDLDKIIMIILFFISFFPFCYDFNKTDKNSYKIEFFGTKRWKEMRSEHYYMQAFSFWIMNFVMSLYEMTILLQPPTLYRTFFFFKFKGFATLSILPGFFAVYLLDNPLIINSLMMILTALLFSIIRVKWLFDPFEENFDLENNKNDI